jgi:hypothetical protein
VSDLWVWRPGLKHRPEFGTDACATSEFVRVRLDVETSSDDPMLGVGLAEKKVTPTV